MKLTKQDIDKVRDIEGFPIGSDEDIIKLSDPPFYTACPNPFIKDFIEENGKKYNEETDEYYKEPFAADVSEGKNDPIYNAHTYHTKVPHKAIMRYILHYTEPGDIVFDGFCGTGMTGVAAQMCGNPESDIKAKIEGDSKNVKWGVRKAILNDLSPIASFIAYNYNKQIDVQSFEELVNQILNDCEKKLGWMYETNHINNSSAQMELLDTHKGIINYTVWSDVFICPNCGKEIVFYEVAANKETGKVSDKFKCTGCGVELSKKQCTRAIKLEYDEKLKENIKIIKQEPVLINYTYNGKKYNKIPDINDLKIIERINKLSVDKWIPTDRMCEGKESRRNDKFGIEYVHQFFYKRTLIYLSEIFDKIQASNNSILKILFTSQLINLSKMNRYRPAVSFPYNPLSGTMYVSSMISEANVLIAYRSKLKKFMQAIKHVSSDNVIVSCGALNSIPTIPDSTIDYIFTDPPFGDNLNYSELSYIWEAWIKVKTNNYKESIINSVQNKGIFEYQELMTECFKEYYRILKPNRWMTVEFHNSKNIVWNAIQESLLRAGFIVADVRTLDKKQGSFKQVTNNSAVKQDLVISVYKPKDSFVRNMKIRAGSVEGVWNFVDQHLCKLPIVVSNGDKVEVIRERENYLLYDRMIAYHITNGFSIPLDASEFYTGLDNRYIKRDGMYFLQDQVNKYDNARMTLEIEPIQFSLFINNEKNAIAWLYQKLEIPQTYSEIQPQFIKELVRDKHEKIPELSELLEENFIQDESGRWYIPDPTKSGDIIKLREKRLIKEFEEYLQGKGKLKLFRTEAVRAGFAKLWKEKDYKNIVKVAKRLPDSVIQEDDKLLMYYDISLSRIEE